MTLHMERKSFRATYYVPASLRDKLTYRGWVECGTCEGDGCQNGFRHEANHCPDCVEGLVPPDGMVEAAAEGLWDDLRNRPKIKASAWPWVGDIVRGNYRVSARAALIAAARWEREQ